ncbi:hypothetical protein LXL04_017976 [Taraxacum kok-saghyz]
MSDILERLVRKVFVDIPVVDLSLPVNALPRRELHWVREWCDNLDRLMKHLKKIMLGFENEEAQDLLKELEEMACNLSLYINGRVSDVKMMLEMEEDPVVVEELEMQVREIILLQTGDVRNDEMFQIIENLYNIIFGSSIQGEEIVVGFNDEVKTLLDQLTQTSIKQFQVISIAGMAGLGKTTLARKLYNDPLIEYHFDIRAWTCVSQTYLKRDLLLGILSSFVYDLSEEIYKMSDEQLGEKLYRLLKGRRYLVVLDDIWDCMVWKDLHIYFPDDKIGSRVLFTSRDIDVTLHVAASRPAHVLRLRTKDESWDIFQKKVFRIGICFLVLKRIGMEIAEKCEGLPLAIVIAAGLVKTELSVRWWLQIAGSLRSFMFRDPSQYMDTLALSYNHLPPHLKSCFLFVHVFPEDYNIPVTKLIWLWIAQGFIHQTGSKVLEDEAECLLMDLIKRSLLMIAEKRADGQIKTCRIHDLLRDLCIRQNKEENLCPQTYTYAPPVPISLSTPSGVCYPSELGSVLQLDGSVVSETYESLRILDMESVLLSLFPSSVVQLGNLRYLAIQAQDGTPDASISKLVNLQMLIILSRKSIVVPKTIWDMRGKLNQIEEPCFVQAEKNDGSPRGLGSLQTLSQVSPQSCHNIFSRTPYLRMLGFCGPLISSLGDMEFPNTRSLEHVHKLKLLNTIPFPGPTRSCNPLMYPKNLKILTLSNIGLDWEETWTFAWLPNLEVLKLKFHACVGEKWETSDMVFERLRVLKLHDLDLRQWVSFSDNFPRLQSLVVHRCLNLKSIPSEIGKIMTLDMIEVIGCNKSTRSSALEIQKEQEYEGNYFLKVYTAKKL